MTKYEAMGGRVESRAGRAAENREDYRFLAAARSRVTPVSAASADCRFVDVVSSRRHGRPNAVEIE